MDDTSPAAAGEGDVRRFRATPEGNFIVELYKDNNALSPIAAMPGASEVKGETVGIGTTSVDRATVVTPASGKKVRIISVNLSAGGLTTNPDEVQVYFGTGGSISTDSTKVIGAYDPGTNGTKTQTWPDGAGPIGAADDVVSWRATPETEAGLRITVIYREE